ncbi:MAG: hypothetical protein J6Q44_01730 [Alphaproteobacteria bacterium]|nr:hypothetical protein [Alphaproteobacteria bacterium]
MAKFNQFSSENILMSVCGHLVLVAIMITSFAIVINRAQLVAPDRIQIMEIDLNDVVVSGDETKLYNVGQVVESKPEEPTPAPVAQPDKKEVKAEEPEKIEVEAPTLVEEPKPEPEPEELPDEPAKEPEKKQEEKKTESKPVEPAPAAPKKKKVVRVNREVLSLERTLTVSVVDALRVAMTRCWVVDTKRPDISDIRAVAHLTMRKNGTVRDVWFESAARAETDPAFAYVLDTIRTAINVCQPFRMLPANEFAKWEKIQLTFYPTQGKVM